MNKPEWICSHEYSNVENLSEDTINWLRQKEFNLHEFKYLGLHFEDDKLKSSHFVGQIWLDQPNVLQIAPKQNEKVDYFAMISECMKQPVIAYHLLADCIEFWEKEKSLPVEKTLKNPVLLLLIARFLKEVSELCRRHIRRGFPRIEKNLYGRCKGKILIRQNIIHNSAKGRADRIYCQFQIHSMDTLENQILRSALEQSLRFLRINASANSLKTLWGWAAESSNVLSEVTLRRIYPAEFQNIRYSGIMKVYKKSHTLAKMILRALGTDPNNPVTETQEIHLPPYSIDMNELFERYCESLLKSLLIKKKYPHSDLWVGYKNNTLPTEDKGIERVRPDFLLKKKNWILDAKYKYKYGKKEWDENDIRQLCKYARHQKVREILSKGNNEPEKLIFLYPKIIDFQDKKQSFEEFSKEIKEPKEECKSFVGIYKVAVPLCK